MPRQLLLALDVGTSSCRAVLYSTGGEVVEITAAPGPPVAHPEPGWAEQPADAIWETVVEVLAELTGRPGVRNAIAAVGVTAQIGTVCVDSAGRPVYSLMNWMDKRAGAEAAWVARVAGVEPIYAASGKRVDPERDACRLLWLARHRPHAWSKVRWAYSLKDFLVHRLTGHAITDPIHASYTLLSDHKAGTWNLELCRTLGIDPGLLPPVVSAAREAGRVTNNAAARTGLPAGLPVAAGGPDGSLGTLGAGLTAPGDAVLVMGTSDVFFACSERPVIDPERGTLFHPHVLPDRWLAGGPQGLAGGTVKWLSELLGTALEHGSRGSAWAELEAEALRLPPGAERLLVLPSLIGERAPVWEPAWRGAVAGLSPVHRPAHLLRAFAEGLAYGNERLVKRLERLHGRPARILAAGGGARSDLRPQITADVTGVEVVCVDNAEATSAGAAICAGIATGLLGFESAGAWARTTRVYRPEPAAHMEHRRLYPLWDRWQESQRETFAALSGIDLADQEG